jgi:thiol-disulfide isomerase/thioredoxin
MNCKALIIVALISGFTIFPTRASEPLTYKEIAMLLRNGEQPQFIMDETARRKLLQPLAPLEEQDLVSLGATPALIKMLESPAMLATPESAAAYNARMQQQRSALQQQQDQQAAAQATPGAPAAPARQQQPAIPQADEFAGKSIDLQFTSTDGAPVNLASLRGKVVLIDFWATWCKPCMKEAPDVVAAYQKYHDKGFEVIGISLDKDEFTMRTVAQEKGMTWPQYFDGQGWQNAMSSKFHIREIPTMWLVNKAGIVATTQAGGNLDTEIAKLLAE